LLILLEAFGRGAFLFLLTKKAKIPKTQNEFSEFGSRD
jgi:hypothetical protein